MHAAVGIALVMIGCTTNVVFLEFIVNEDPGCGNIVTFTQFLFIAIEGFIFQFQFGRNKSVIPIWKYMIMVVMFFLVSVVNNYALNFNVPLPLHMIFRAGSLIANMVLGIIILHKKYTISKYFSVMLITAGIAICTLMSAKSIPAASDDDASTEQLIRWVIGISMLIFALFLSARLGIFQETLYAEFGKHPKEALFYSHALPLPGFLLLGADIYSRVIMYNNSEPISLALLGVDVGMPKIWLYLIGNCITQYVCIRGVFILTTECESLTVTLVITLRKFISLVFSILYFQNPFTTGHWAGTLCVFGGTLLFTEVPWRIYEALSPKKDTKTE